MSITEFSTISASSIYDKTSNTKFLEKRGQKGRRYAREGYAHICRVVNEEKNSLALQALQVLTAHTKDKIKIYWNIMFGMCN